MFNKKLVIAGLIIFVGIITFPFWFNQAKVIAPPEVKLTERAKEAKECVLPDKLKMRGEHMQLLDVWRGTVVREGNRKYVGTNGKEYEMSLSNTCLDCHSNKADFCDKCHEYASVDPYCWDCHIDNPKETK